MDLILKLFEYFPPFDLLETILRNNPMELAITGEFYEIVKNIRVNNLPESNALDDIMVMVSATKDHLWEVINTGHFSKVNKLHRQLYSLMSLQKAILLLIKDRIKTLDGVNEKCMWEIDNGLLLGCPLDHPNYNDLLNDCLTHIQKSINNENENITESGSVHNLILDDCRPSNQICDIDILNRPALQQFKENYFDRSKPLILTECMSQWPALLKWIQPNYLLNICRNRTVPIEIGKNYTNENWSQDLVKFEEFFRRQITGDGGGTSFSESSQQVEYLAQHNLFEQIPELRNDIITPEYCCITNHEGDEENDIDIKAWLGPEGTISPMHIDKKHNLLCQVFGSKRIMLAAPKDSVNLYPFDGEMLNNTSQIDAEHLDFDRFPLVRNVRFYSFTLHKGEMLYIPPKWWHYVRSLSKSFSVSFWWE